MWNSIPPHSQNQTANRHSIHLCAVERPLNNYYIGQSTPPSSSTHRCIFTRRPQNTAFQRFNDSALFIPSTGQSTWDRKAAKGKKTRQTSRRMRHILSSSRGGLRNNTRDFKRRLDSTTIHLFTRRRRTSRAPGCRLSCRRRRPCHPALGSSPSPPSPCPGGPAPPAAPSRAWPPSRPPSPRLPGARSRATRPLGPSSAAPCGSLRARRRSDEAV